APAMRGQAIHAFLEAAAKVGREDALLEVSDEYRMVCESIDLEALPPLEGLSPEVALAYVPETGDSIALDGVEGREYGSLPAGAIPGTADLIGLLDDDAVFIGDYKTGWTAPRAETSMQIRMYALMAAR